MPKLHPESKEIIANHNSHNNMLAFDLEGVDVV